jgi:outer membrane receptor for ferrienterochelin and colicin
LLAGLTGAILGQVSSARGQSTPSAPAPATSAPAPPVTRPDPQSENEIVVVGQGAERGSIDRTTYLVRDNAEARSANTLEILRRIPSVDVTPDGQIRLLGTSGVKILIDGKEVADPEAMLRSMQGSQIAKVEVISNPSAQFSAQGTAGIINIVTRRSFAAGVRGSATASGGSFGAGELKLAPSWSKGPWSLSGSVDLDHYGTPLGFARDRISLDPHGAILAETVENGITRNRFDDASGNLVISYKPGPKQSVTFSAEGYGYRGHSPQQSTIATLGDPFATQSRTSAGTFTGHDQDFALDYRRDGAREGETLTASAKYSSFDNQNDDNFTTDPASGAPTAFRIRSDNSDSVATLKLDYVRPFDAKRRLSLGGTIEDTRNDLVQRQGGSLPAGDPLPESASTIDGAWTDKAAYLTYQFPLAGGTVLAGLRFEDRAYRFGADSPIRTLDRNDFFPSLHVERQIAKWLTGHLSYSRRVAWRASSTSTRRCVSPTPRPRGWAIRTCDRRSPTPMKEN